MYKCITHCLPLCTSFPPADHTSALVGLECSVPVDINSTAGPVYVAFFTAIFFKAPANIQVGS